MATKTITITFEEEALDYVMDMFNGSYERRDDLLDPTAGDILEVVEKALRSPDSKATLF